MDNKEENKSNNTFLLILTIIIIGIGLYMYSANKPTTSVKDTSITLEDAKALVTESFGEEVKVKDIQEDGQLYKITVTAKGNEQDLYLTKDGQKFIFQLIDVDEIKANKVSKEPVKSDKPNVELFVMSYCPFGTQFEKGYLPAIEKLGDKIDSEVKFVSYVMHGKKEAQENLREYCINKENPEKFNSYLTCFLGDKYSNLTNKKDGDRIEISKKCMEDNSIDLSKNTSCVEKTSKEIKLDEAFKKGDRFPKFNTHKDLNSKYGVKGSPTLVVNGKITESSRDSNSILKAICESFNNPPKECNEFISDVLPSTGFGYSEPSEKGSETPSNASCGS